MSASEVRIDLHVHSKYSQRPSQWILQKIGCPESFVEPVDIYRIARSKGMTHVTITDHNRIEGALEIAHLPNTFVSEEITSYFPEDQCKIHVLAHNIDEKQHEDIQKVRQNVFELVDYLNRADIFHAIAHPLFGVNDRLQISHFEQMLLLFKTFELNGSRNDSTNTHLKSILGQLTPEAIERLADKYNLEPCISEPWIKNIIGGSDDHSSLNIARTYTVIPNADTVDSALDGILEQRAEVVRHPSTPLTFAQNLYSIAYQFYRNKFRLAKYVRRDLLLSFLDHTLLPGAHEPGPGLISKLYYLWHYRKQPKVSTQVPESLAVLLRSETGRLLHDDPELMQLAKGKSNQTTDVEAIWFNFVNQVSNRVLYHFASHLFGHLSGANVFNIFHTIGSSAGLSALLAPYYIAFSHFSHDRRFSRQVCETLGLSSEDDSAPVRCGHFVDYTVSPGQSSTGSWQETIKKALRKDASDHVLTCGSAREIDTKRLKVFKPVGTFDSPADPEKKLYFPPVMEMLNYCYARQLDRIHAASPGPIGLAALAVGHMLKIPVDGTYDISYNAYIQRFAGDEDESISELINRFILWFYDQMDTIFVLNTPSEKALRKNGISEPKIKRLYPEIDLSRFNPSRRNGFLSKQYGILEKRKLLYEGPVAKDNNLHLLAEIYKMLHRKHSDLHLVVVGNGPYRKEMEHVLSGAPCTFTGNLAPEELSVVYASSDMFILPGNGTSDSSHLARAQASGLPIIVSDRSESVRQVTNRHNGLVVKGNDATSLYEAVQTLLTDSHLADQLGRAARATIENQHWCQTLSEPLRQCPPSQPADPIGLRKRV